MRTIAPYALILLVACETAPAEDDEPGTSTGGESGTPSSDTGDEPVATTGASEPGSTDAGHDSTGADPSTGGELDATTTTGANADRVPMFVAQGMIGRTVVSCDDGHTWVADRSWEQEADPLLCGSTEPIRCWETSCDYLSGGECVTSSPECDCGHHPGFSKGVAFGNGWFVATWGWGHSGSVRRSANGIDWEETLTEDVTFGGLAFGGDRFVLANRSPMHSSEGTDWVAGAEADFRGPGGEVVWSVRRFAYADYDGGRFVATAEPPKSVLVSSDGGQSWWAPSVLPDACLTGMSTYGGIASTADGIIVGVGQDGTACRSTDGGDTWTESTVGGDNVLGHLLWTGSELVTWGPGVRYSSPDGVEWTQTPTTPEGIWIGPAAHGDATGSFVAVTRVWDGYEDQSFVRSDDGVNWEVLQTDAFTGGHPIFSITHGYAEPSELCPVP